MRNRAGARIFQTRNFAPARIVPRGNSTAAAGHIAASQSHTQPDNQIRLGRILILPVESFGKLHAAFYRSQVQLQ